MINDPQDPLDLEDPMVAEMVENFLSEYDDPVNWTPHDRSEGGYQYLHPGEPFNAREVLRSLYPHASEKSLKEAGDFLEKRSFVWVCKSNYYDQPMENMGKRDDSPF